LFLPAAVLAAFLAGLCIGSALMSAAATDVAAFGLLLLCCGLQGAAFVLAGAATAPERQRMVAWWLATAFGIYAVVTAFEANYDEGVLHLSTVVANTAGGFLAAFLFGLERPRA
jgi:hypothetical protein